MRALRIAEAYWRTWNTAPWVYVALFGYVLFDHVAEQSTVLGALIIVLSAVFIYRLER